MQTQDPQNESGTETIIPVEKEALQTSDESVKENVTEKESFVSRFGKAFRNFIKAFFRLLVILIFIGALYYSVPYFVQTFIEPTQKNTVAINGMEIQISAILTKQSDLDSRLLVVEDTVESYSVSIANLEEIQSTIENQLQESNNQVLLKMKHEVMLTRTFDMLGRARLYLSQSNFGLAQEDVQNARDILFALTTETNDEVLNQAITRLDLALANLPEFPVVASGDLEIAWQILMSGKASVVATSTPTPAPFVETFTPTPFDIPSATPTP